MMNKTDLLHCEINVSKYTVQFPTKTNYLKYLNLPTILKKINDKSQFVG